MLLLALFLPLLVLSQDPLPGVPGLPGADYPVLNSPQKTSFDCNDGFIPGYYAHTEVRIITSDDFITHPQGYYPNQTKVVRF